MKGPTNGGRWRHLPLRVLFGNIFGNASLGVLSLALAVLVWALVKHQLNSTGTTTVADVPVKAENVPRGYTVTQISPDHISVRVTASGRVLSEVGPKTLPASVDLSGADRESAADDFSVERRIKVTENDATDLQALPGTVKITLEKLVSRKVPVQLVLVGNPPLGYEAGDSTAKPEVPAASTDLTEVTIEGAPRNVNAVSAAVAEVKLDGITLSVTKQLPLEPRDKGQTIGGVRVDPEQASVRINIRQTLFQKNLSVIVNPRGRPKLGYQVTSMIPDPAFVTVTGPLDQLGGLLSVQTEPIDVEGAANDLVRLVKLQLPPGVSVAKGDGTVRVSVGVQTQRAPGVLPGVVPRVINLAPGLTATPTTPLVVVQVSGPVGDVAQVRSTDIGVTLDVAGKGPGTYDIEPKAFGVPPTIQVESILPDKIKVVIEQAR